MSEEASQHACNKLSANFSPDVDEIQESLGLVFVFVHNLLSKDQQLHGRLANQDEYRNNVKHFGEDSFIQLLRDTAEKKNWKDLFHHGTLYLYLTRTH